MVENKDKELSLDILDEISGGKIKLTGYAMLTALIAQVKALGKSKERCIEMLRGGWETNCDFKTKFTDQTDDDLEKAIEFVKKHW